MAVAGYEVDFPHPPYGTQLGFMHKMLKALDAPCNALLERCVPDWAGPSVFEGAPSPSSSSLRLSAATPLACFR